MKKVFFVFVILMSLMLLGGQALDVRQLSEKDFSAEFIAKLRQHNASRDETSLSFNYPVDDIPHILPAVGDSEFLQGTTPWIKDFVADITGYTAGDPLYFLWSQSDNFIVETVAGEATQLSFTTRDSLWWGEETLAITISDQPLSPGDMGSATWLFTIKVKNVVDSPVFNFPNVDAEVPDGYVFSTPEDTPITVNFIGNMPGTSIPYIESVDNINSPSSIQLFITPTSMDVAYTQANGGAGVGTMVTFTPPENVVGEYQDYTFLLTAKDRNFGSISNRTIKLRVTQVNDPPEISEVFVDGILVEDTIPAFDQGSNHEFLVEATDMDGDDLYYSWVLSGENVSHELSDLSNFTMHFNDPGFFTLTLYIDDRADGSGFQISRTWDITVSPVGPQFDPLAVLGPFTEDLDVEISAPGAEDATIYYSLVDETGPWQEYLGPITIPILTDPVQGYQQTVWAYFSLPGGLNSVVQYQTYEMTGTVQTPVFGEVGGRYLPNNPDASIGSNYKLELSTSPAAANIEYSFDNGTSWLPYDAVTGIQIPAQNVENIVAKASLAGWIDSDISPSQEYVINDKVDFLQPVMATVPPPDLDGYYCVCFGDSVQVDFSALSANPALATIYYSLEPLGVPAQAQTYEYNPASGEPHTLYLLASTTLRWWAEYTDATADPGAEEWFSSDVYSFDIPVRNRTRMLFWDEVTNPTVFNPIPQSLPAGHYDEPIEIAINTEVVPDEEPGADIWYRYKTDDMADFSDWLPYSSPIYADRDITIQTYASAIPPYTTLESLVHEGVYSITGTLPIPLVSHTSPPSDPYTSPWAEIGGEHTYEENLVLGLQMPAGDRWQDASIFFSLDNGVSFNLYTAPVELISGHYQLVAYAVKDNWIDSAQSQVADYFIRFLPQVTFTTNDGPLQIPDPLVALSEHYQQIELSLFTYDAAEIRYTLDGTEPTATSALYGAPITLGTDPLVTAEEFVLKAIAIKTGWVTSDPITWTFKFIPTMVNPVFEPAATDHTMPINVSIVADQNYAPYQIYYLEDPSGAEVPGPDNGILYEGQFEVDSSRVIAARAYKDGFMPSEVVYKAYNIANTIGDIVFNPPAGTYTETIGVTLSTLPVEAELFFSVNNVDWHPYTSQINMAAGYEHTLYAKAELPGSETQYGQASYTLLDVPLITPIQNQYHEGDSIDITITAPLGNLYYSINSGAPQLGVSPVTLPGINSDTLVMAWAENDGVETTHMMRLYEFHPQLTPPVANVVSGTYYESFGVELSHPTADDIYYSLDNVNFSVYFGEEIQIGQNQNLYAYATKTHFPQSDTREWNYLLKVRNPQANLATGEYAGAREVSFSINTTDADIYYNTESADLPFAEWISFDGTAIPVTESTQFWVMGTKANWLSSDVLSFTYTINDAVDAVEFDPAGGTYYTEQTVTLSTVSPGADIYYSLDGTAPNTLYAAPLSVDANTLIRARATKQNWLPSAESSAQYVLKVSPISDGGIATIHYEPITVSLSTPTDDAAIYYTLDGSIPSSMNGTEYSAPLQITESSTLKAIAVRDSWTDSDIYERGFVINQRVATPVFNPAGGLFTYSPVEVQISTETADASIYYRSSLDGEWILYNPVLEIAETTLIQAKASKDGWVDSEIVTQQFIIDIPETPQVASPVFSPQPGTFNLPTEVSITSETAGATIYYTTDGSEPGPASDVYSTPIPVANTTTIKAYAVLAAYTDSDVSTGEYIIAPDQVLDPVVFPESGTYSESFNVVLISPTPGSTILYQMNEETELWNVYNPATPILISESSTIRVKATKVDMIDSAVIERVYTITRAVTMGVVDMPEGTYNNAITVSFSAPNPADATIYYTLDGTEPTEASNEYTVPILIDAVDSQDVILKAKAFRSGWIESQTASHSYSFRVAAVEFDPPGGTYTQVQELTLSSATEDAQIYYTLDGSAPNEGSNLYSGPITVAVNRTIRARAYKGVYMASPISSAVYAIDLSQYVVANPIFSPASTSSFSPLDVSIETDTEDASIRYTTNGMDPNPDYGTIYTGLITVPANTAMFIKAIAYKDGWTPSAVVAAYYSVTGTVAEVSFNPEGGTYTNALDVELNTATEGSTIRYTIDGSDPTALSPVYNRPITLNGGTTTIKAVAFKSDWQQSEISEQTYTITGTVAFNQPIFNPAGGSYGNEQAVSIASPIPATAQVYYTLDGSTPDPMNPNTYLYTPGTQINITGDTTINAVAILDGWETSDVMTAVYQFRANAPQFSIAGGWYESPQIVELSSSTTGAAIRYTLDGTIPDAGNGMDYTGPININVNRTITAYAFKDGYQNSEIVSQTYAIGEYVPVVATPTFSVESGIYQNPQTVEITTATPGATIRYTTDGSDPSETLGTIYTAPVSISSNSSLKAIAYKEDWQTSQLATANYVITGTVAAVQFNPAGGTYSTAQTVVLTSATQGAYFYYTTDGSDPSLENGSLYTTGIYVPLNSSMSIRARAYKENWTPSSIAEASYNITGKVVISDPVFSVAPGTYATTQSLEFGSPDPSDAEIRYTTDGSDPSLPTSAYLVYDPDSPLELELGAVRTIKVSAHKTNWVASPVYTAVYNMTGTVLLPENMFDPVAGTYQTPQTITLDTSTYPAEALLRYTLNGGEPNEGSPAYNAQTGIAISGSATLKVKGFMPGWISSETAEAAYNITGTVVINAPVFTPPAGTYTTAQSVVIGNTNPADATIRYTTDGTEPTASSPLYSAPIQLAENSTTTLKVKAFMDDWDDSPSYEATYTITGQVAMTTPVFDPIPGTYTEAISVSLNTTTVPAGAQIYYTTDGSDPNESSQLYTGTAIQINANEAVTIRARAFYQDWLPSEIYSANYSVTGTAGIVGTVFSPEPGIYNTAQTVIISTSTYPLGAVVHYTTDGSEPGADSPIYAPNTPIQLGLNSITTINAKVFAPGWINSPTYTGVYTITGTVSVAGISLTPAPGVYQTLQNVFYSGMPLPNDAVLRYTTNGADPIETDPVFSAALTPPLNSTLNLKLRAFKDGWIASDVIAAEYIFTGQVALPATMFTPPAGTYQSQTSVTLNTATIPAAATLRYTLNNTPPTVDSPAYTEPIVLPAGSGITNIRVRGFLENWLPSAELSATYNITGQVAFNTPVFTPAAGTYSTAVEVQVNETAPADATIRYTTDGSEPTASSQILTGNINLNTLNSTHTIKVKAFKTDWTPSATQTAVYVLTGQAAIAGPQFSPAPGTYTEAQSVTINTDATPANATIRYTLDGSDPTPSSPIYSAPIQVALNSSVTIRARAFAVNWTPSEVYVGHYEVTGQVAFVNTPIFTPEAGIYTGSQVVTISQPSPAGATIRYTIDGSEPTEGSAEYSAGINLPLDSTTTIKVRAWAEDWIPSAVHEATYTITGQVELSGTLFSPEPGLYTEAQDLMITAEVYPTNAVIHYTTDGSEPTLDSETYTGGTLLNIPLNTENLSLKVRAFADNWIASEIYTAVYTITGTVQLAANTFSPAPGTYTTEQQIVLAAPALPQNARLRYSLNGEDPTEQSPAYTAPIAIPTNSENVVLKVRGYSEGWIPSAVLTANYKVTGTLPAPEFNYPSGLYGNVSGTEYEDGLKITLAVDEEYSNVSIYYTTDGSDPTQDSTLFTDPIRVPDLAQGFTIRAKAFKPDWISSAISEEVYSYLLLPLNVRTITYEGYVRVLWSNPNARGLDGFNVYRKAANESAYRKLNDELVPVGQTIGGEHYYDDYEISNNMSYQYYVTAVYDGVESEDSGVTSAEYQTSELDVTENTRAYPNPAENSTTFQIKLSRNDNVQITISIFDFAGKKVRTLTGANLNTNLVEIPWDLKTDSGAKVGRGTYFARIQASDSAKRSEKVIKISVK
jgi:hypothetical protein